MEIGKPKRIYRVEPLQEPVPAKRRPVERPERERRQPATAPAK